MDDTQANFRIGDLVLYKNNQILALNKPNLVPVQDDKTGDKSLLGLAEIYAQSKLHLIHRLDRPASGVVLFAKTSGAVAALSAQFQERTVVKTYLALVKDRPEADEGTLVHHLSKGKTGQRAKVSDAPTEDSQEAEMHYRYLGSTAQYHLLEVRLHTGRHHQIRAQLAAIGCPIKGDVKYGARRANKDRSIHLHAWRISFTHPVSGERETITAPLPEDPVWQAVAALGYIVPPETSQP